MKELKKRREAAGYTQEQLAAAMKTTQSAVAKWESPGNLPRADKLPMLAQLFNCTIDDLFQESEAEGPTPL